MDNLFNNQMNLEDGAEELAGIEEDVCETEFEGFDDMTLEDGEADNFDEDAEFDEEESDEEFEGFDDEVADNISDSELDKILSSLDDDSEEVHVSEDSLFEDDDEFIDF